MLQDRNSLSRGDNASSNCRGNTPLFAVSAFAESPQFNAGVARLTVPDETSPIDTVVFYPTNAPEVAWQAGPFIVNASRNAAPVADQRFPVVLLSHGRRGGPLSHRDLAVALARAGFIVVVPTHVGDASGFPLAKTQAQVLIDRPRQAEGNLTPCFRRQGSRPPWTPPGLV